MKKTSIQIQNNDISVKLSGDDNDYISLTDMAKFKDAESTGTLSPIGFLQNTLSSL